MPAPVAAASIMAQIVLADPFSVGAAARSSAALAAPARARRLPTIGSNRILVTIAFVVLIRRAGS